MMEKPPPPAESAPAYEPEVVARLHLNHDKMLSGQIPYSEKLLTETRADLSRLECYPIYKEYVEGNIPTLSSIEESTKKAADTIDKLLQEDKKNGSTEEELAEEIKIQKLLSGRANSIKRNIGAYVQSVIHFHRLKQNYHDNPQDFERADHNRRRAHDGLLQALEIMTKTMKQAEAEGLLTDKKIIEWIHGMDLKSFASSPDTIVIFSEKVLKDREYIRDWAIAADFDSQLQDMLAVKDKK